MSTVFKIVKRIFISLFFLLIIAIVGILLWRINSADDPKSMETLNVNEALYTSYSAHGKELYMFKQEQRTITSAENNYGYFAITNYTVIPDANQIQTTVRYNNSTLKYTAEDFELSEIPSRDEEVYDITLLFAIDLTPDNEEDNLGNDEDSVKFVRCHGTVTMAEQKNLYNFRQMVFDLDSAELDIEYLLESKLLLAIYADFYYNGALDYEKAPYGTLCLYDFKSENITVKLDKKDIEALTKYGE